MYIKTAYTRLSMKRSPDAPSNGKVRFQLIKKRKLCSSCFVAFNERATRKGKSSEGRTVVRKQSNCHYMLHWKISGSINKFKLCPIFGLHASNVNTILTYQTCKLCMYHLGTFWTQEGLKIPDYMYYQILNMHSYVNVIMII
jgi:hypothetical protein